MRRERRDGIGRSTNVRRTDPPAAAENATPARAAKPTEESQTDTDDRTAPETARTRPQAVAGTPMDLSDLKEMTIQALNALARELASRARRA